MARGNSIIVSGNPRGVFAEGVITGALKPGILMGITAATAPVAGDRFNYGAYAPSGGDGKPGPIALLLEDKLQGKLMTDAYVTLTPCFLYYPVAGETFNVMCGEVAGTGNTYAIGDLLMPDAEDGLLVPNSSGVSVPFQVLETITQSAGNVLVWCLYTGH